MKSWLLIVGWCAVGFCVFGQRQGSGVFDDDLESFSVFVNSCSVTITEHKPVELPSFQKEDKLHDSIGGYPYRFGVATEQNLALSSITRLAEGNEYHSFLPVYMPGATSINVGFKNLDLSPLTRIYLYDKGYKTILGPLVANDVYQGYLGTELIFADTIIIHIISDQELLSGQLDYATYGYRSKDGIEADLRSTCHINVVCPEADEYEQIKNGVVLLLNGPSSFCSGSMIANTAYDGKPYVLTASHCYLSNPANWVFRFNFQAEFCDGVDSGPYTSVSGGVLRARYASSDFCLIEIIGGLDNGQLPASTNAFFNGWDFTGRAVSSAVGIHHPSGVVKKISFDDHLVRKASVQSGSFTSLYDGVWKIIWDRGTATEAKSSGSPLFDNYKRIIGQLWGGSSSCTSTSNPDFYGRFALSWDHEADSSAQLKYWLDPNNLSNGLIDGHALGEGVQNLEVAVSMDLIYDAVCVGSDSLVVWLSNVGNDHVYGIQYEYSFDNWQTVLNGVFDEGLSSLESSKLYFSLVNLQAGVYEFGFRITSIDGGMDGELVNNSVFQSFRLMQTQEPVHLELHLDCYASETTWEIRDVDDLIVFRSPLYANYTDKGLKNYDFCLSDGCYRFVIYDQYGDGFSYVHPSGCLSGSLRLTRGDHLYGEILQANADFGLSYSIDFCVGFLNVSNTSHSFKLFPNPVTDLLTIQSDLLIDQINIYSLEGRLVDIQILGSALRHDVQLNLSAGLYILEGVQNQQKQFTTKILVE